jgi:hypothetical protein
MHARVHVAGVFMLVLAAAGSAAAAGVNRIGTAAAMNAPAAGSARLIAAPLPDAAAVKLDGEFSEAAWSLAVPIDAFLQREPREGEPPAQRTEVRVLYDKTNLYVAVRAFDTEPGKIVGIRTRRDADSPSDWIRLFVDSYHDHRTAYSFGVNAAGVKTDVYYFADGNEDSSWDAVWDVSVTKDREGWKAEFRIPFSQLRFEPGKRDTFGFAVLRQVGRTNEVSTWPLVAKSKNGVVSQFGDLGGLSLSSSGKRLEFMPYLVGHVDTQPTESGNPFVSSSNTKGSVGADLKFALTPGMTLTATINPDFGQVEADPAVVNLTSFETFYTERRPFFVEGSGNLRFNLDCNDDVCTGLFYSRRIGRQPRGEPDVPDGGFVSAPMQTTILGAAKLTGRVGAFAVGALTAFTANENAELALGSTRWNERVEPFSNYTLVQAKREWANQSSLGFMLTNTARSLNDDVGFLPSGATTGGVNWDWRVFKKQYAVQGYWAASNVRGSAEAIDTLQQSSVHNYQRPDADYIDYDPTRTSLNGQAGSLSFSKISGKKVRFNFNSSYKTPGFDINDVGYLKRADTVGQSSWVQFRFDTPTKYYRTFRLNLNQWGGWNFGGDKRYMGANVNAHVVWNSNWDAGVGGNFDGSGYDDRSTRGGPAMRSKTSGNVWYYVDSDSRKPLVASWSGYNYWDESDSSAWQLAPSLTYRATSFLTVTGGLSFEKTNEDSQWVENVENGSSTDYVFGRISQTTAAVTARVNYTITPNLTIQVYAQPFVSAGAYSDFKKLVRPNVKPFADQFQACAYSGNPDFNYKSFRTTNVLRWEYKPGSSLYVVWQQGREGTAEQGRFRFGHDLGDMFDIKGSNVFLVKFSYWFNL